MNDTPTPIRRRKRPAANDAADSGEDRPKGGQVQSITRALSILNALCDSGDGMSLTEVAETVGLAPSTAHRLLTTLQAERFVRFDSSATAWQIGVQAFIVGNAFLRTRQVVGLARPYMQRLMNECGETVNLAVEDNGEAVYMSQVESRQMMRAIARPGGRVKMHCSGVGKAVLAWMSDIEVAKILRVHGLPRMTQHTLDSPQRLRDDLEEIRARGYAIDDEENAIGLRCVSAPIFDENGDPLAALSLSGPAARIPDPKLAALGSMVMQTSEKITAELGGAPPALRGGTLDSQRSVGL